MLLVRVHYLYVSQYGQRRTSLAFFLLCTDRRENPFLCILYLIALVSLPGSIQVGFQMNYDLLLVALEEELRSALSTAVVGLVASARTRLEVAVAEVANGAVPRN